MRIIYNSELLNEKQLNKMIEPFQADSGLIGIVCSTNFDCIVANCIMKSTNISILLIPPYLPESMIDSLLQDVYVSKVYTLDHGNIIRCQNRTGSFLHLEPSSWLFVTSASTGHPKIVYKTKKQLDAEVSRYIRKLNVTEEDVIFPAVPLYHNYGFVCGLLVAQMANTTLIFEEKLYPSKVIRRVNEFAVTILFSVPVFYKEMLHCHILLKDSLRYLIVSCASIENTLLCDFQTYFGYYLTQQYGATETGSLALSIESDCAGTFSDKMEDVFFQIDKKTGEILISSANTIGSYIKKNQIVSLDSLCYHSGDQGNYEGVLQITGRIDDIINICGRKISLSFIQKQLLEIPRVQQVFVSSIKHQNGTFIRCEYQGVLYSKEEINTYCKKLLPEYCIPWLIFETSSIYRWKENLTWEK